MPKTVPTIVWRSFKWQRSKASTSANNTLPEGISFFTAVIAYLSGARTFAKALTYVFSLVIVIFLCILGLLVWVGWNAVQNNISFGLVFSRFVILLAGYKLFDIICFDWILLTKLNIIQALFPETIGCKGYQKFGFNFKSQLVKVFAFLLLSAVLSAIVINL